MMCTAGVGESVGFCRNPTFRILCVWAVTVCCLCRDAAKRHRITVSVSSSDNEELRVKSDQGTLLKAPPVARPLLANKPKVTQRGSRGARRFKLFKINYIIIQYTLINQRT